MKHLRHLFTTLLLLCCSIANAQDFEVGGIFYNITDATNKTVAVTYSGISYDVVADEYIGSVVIPESVTYNNVTYNVTSIGDEAFCSCANLTGITIPNCVSGIGDYAFWGAGITSIEIPNSVTSIGDAAFKECPNLKLVINLTTIGLSSNQITFPCKVASAPNGSREGDFLFNNVEGVNTLCAYVGNDSEISLPTDYKGKSYIIGTNAFVYDTTITSVTIPNSVTSIGESAFRGCTGITNISIPNSVKNIDGFAFYGSGLVEVELGNGIDTLETGTFAYCENLTKINLPVGIIQLGLLYNNGQEGVFEGCSNLASIVIPESVTTIGALTFNSCSNLKEIEIPNSVTDIREGAFLNCANLVDVTSKATIAPTIFNEPFNGISSSAVLRYPAGSDYSSWEPYFASTEVFGAVTGITLSASEAVLNIGETYELAATIAPEDAFVKSVTWSSSNEAVATVDQNGVVTAVAAGDAIITATANDGSGVSATCNVTVAEEQSGDDVTYDNTIYASDIEAKTGTQVLLPICMDNVNEITALQFDLYLPEGITIAKDEDDFHIMELSERATARHTFESADMTDGAVRVICYSTRNTVFTGNAGEVMYVTVNVAEELADGEYEVLIKEIELTTPEEVAYNVPVTTSKITVFSYTKGDINDDGKISVTDITGLVNLILSGADYTENRAADVNEDRKLSVTDITGLVNLILNPATESTSSATAAQRVSARAAASTNTVQIAPFAISAGEEKEIYVLMDNPGDAFCGFQFNLNLPEGIELLQDELGYFVELGSRTTSRKHAIESAEQKDGSVLVLCYSGKNMAFSGESGDVAVLTVKAADDLQAGVYNIEVNNIELSRPDETNAAPADYTGSVVAGDGGATELVLDGYFTADAMSEISGALAVKSDIVSVDITSAVYVDSEGSLTTGNSNTLVLLPSGESIANESNVVVDGFCQNLQLTDKMPFNAPAEFTAVNASYSRSFAAPTTATFVLPVAVPTAAVNGKVYKLSGYEGDLIKFSRVTEESLEANIPYVVVVEAAGELLNSALTNAEVVATPEDISVESGEIKHVGAYRTQEVVSGAETYYGYSGGMFVKANNGTLYPFRTMIAASGDAVFSNSYRTDFGEGTTGIDSVGTEGDDAIYFDLQGRRVKRTENGVYIINGKKTFIK